MRAGGHTPVAVVALAGHVHLAPAGAGGDDDAAGAQRGTAVEADLEVLATVEGGRPLAVEDVYAVGADVAFERARERRSFGGRDRDEVFDRHRVQHLAAEAVGDDGGAHALACRVNRRCRAGRAAADDEHVIRFGVRRRAPRLGAMIAAQAADDLLQRHPALAEGRAVQEDGRYREDVAPGDLVLVQRAVDHGVADPRVDRGHQVQGLDDVGAVLAAERDNGLEDEVGVDGSDRGEELCIGLRGDATGLQQGKHERGEFVTERHAGKAHPGFAAGGGDGERRSTDLAVGVLDEADAPGQGRNLGQQRPQCRGGRRVVEGGGELDGRGQPVEVGGELAFQCRIKHGSLRRTGPARSARADRMLHGRVRSCRRGPATARASARPGSTSRGRPRPDGWRRTARPGPCAAVPVRRDRCRCRAPP